MAEARDEEVIHGRTARARGPYARTMSSATINQSSLAKAISEVALLRGTFTLRSGKTSSYYLDKYLFSTRPELLRQLAPLFGDRLTQMEARAQSRVDRLAGAELGGIPLVTATSLHTGLPCIFVRNKKKDYGTAKQLEGVLNAGDKVVLVEDVATTGGQALEAVESLRESGANVLGVIATIDRLEGARENVERAGLIFEALFTKRDLGVDE
jgi:orotate phosphoribosyltransferase